MHNGEWRWDITKWSCGRQVDITRKWWRWNNRRTTTAKWKETFQSSKTKSKMSVLLERKKFWRELILWMAEKNFQRELNFADVMTVKIWRHSVHPSLYRENHQSGGVWKNCLLKGGVGIFRGKFETIWDRFYNFLKVFNFIPKNLP